ncbi:DUF485 domain-containing protein [Streptomyces scopuliridis]|uniref:Membrane protein n=2 Tax=Streptomyces scopuliridis TaxID=452529 RepID=A0A2T7T8I3_9ACTN|nr:DUF485 domain-containing protein [Streptomyces scopuliridis]PVE11412.1 membrane protein [Streptomyces scopuliridis RB72]WSB36539.1 DUF485 domain-containing protein [Streptomyces scopuliridis]WSC00843.1 DUF485 domain-containing protein [Streptomyces scopuliridis]WSC05546.1 DUF485 domain-containing protein [Streptomyces scopuliridis]
MASDAPPPKGGTDTSPAQSTPDRSTTAQPTTAQFVEVQESAEFGELRRAYRSFAFPLTIAFIAWYLLYVLLSNYAGGFMGTKLFGNINVALILGLAQFVTTFLIAWFYARHASRKLDPKADVIKSRMEADA